MSNEKHTSLSRLIESELDKAEVILAARSVVEKMTKMASQLVTLEGDDIMPMIGAVSEAFGGEMSEKFHATAVDNIRSAAEALQEARDAISKDIDNLERILNGEAPVEEEPVNDMAMGVGMEEPEAVEAEPEAPAEPEDDFDPFAEDPDAGAAGRARKESVCRRERPIMEKREGKRKKSKHTRFLFGRPYPMYGYPPFGLFGYVPFGSGEQGQEAGEVVTEAVKFKKHLSARSDDMAISAVPGFEGKDAETLMALVNKAVMGMTGWVQFEHEGQKFRARRVEDDFYEHGESIDVEAILYGENMLREARNPDAVVVETFLRNLRESRDPAEALRMTAEALSIDAEDIVGAVKDARAKAAEKAVEEAKKPDADKDGIPDWADKNPKKAGGKADRKLDENEHFTSWEHEAKVMFRKKYGVEVEAIGLDREKLRQFFGKFEQSVAEFVEAYARKKKLVAIKKKSPV